MLLTIFTFNKLERYERSHMKDNGQRYQLVVCYDIWKMSVSFRYHLKRLCNVLSWSVSLRYQLVRRLKLVGFIYVPVKRRKNVSSRSVLLTYQLRRCDDVLAPSRTFKLASKMSPFLLGTRQYVFRHLRWFSVIKVLASTSLQHLKDVALF